MDQFRAMQLGGLQYQLQYYQGLQGKALQNQAEVAQAENEKNLEALIKKTGKKSIFSTVGTALTTVGGPLAFQGLGKIGKQVFQHIKAENALNSGEKGPTGVTDARYDRDLDQTMNEIERSNPRLEDGSGDAEEAEEPIEEAPEIGEPMADEDIEQFADPAFESKLTTFTPPEDEIGDVGEIGETAEGFAPETENVYSGFSAGQSFGRMQYSMDDEVEDLMSKIDSGEIQPTEYDPDADPEEGLNFFQKALSRMVFGKPAPKAAPAEPEYTQEDLDEIDYDTGGDDVGVPLDPETLQPIGQAPAEVEDVAQTGSELSPEIQAMIEAGNRAGDAENALGDANLLDEWNTKFGTNYSSLEDAYANMGTDTAPKAEVVEGLENIPEGTEFDPSSVEYVDDAEDFGPPPPKPPRVQSLRLTEEVEEAPEEAEAAVEEAPQEAAQSAEEIGQSLARQQYSASDSTLARLFNAPRAGSNEAAAIPEEGEEGAQIGEEAEEESPYRGFQFGDAEPEEAGEEVAESAGQEAGEIGAETGAEIGGEIGADVATDVAATAGIEAGIGTAEAAIAPTLAIPGVDIATGIIGGILGLAGIGFSIYNAVEEGEQEKKSPEVQQPDPTQLAPQPGVAGHYVGAQAENYFMANQHFSGF